MSAEVPCPVCKQPIAATSARCLHCGTDFSAPTMVAATGSTLTRLSTGQPAESQPLLEDLVATLGQRFHGLRRLGRGGMGEVFLGRDPLLKRDVAIKVLAPEWAADTSARERFVREAQAAAAVAHPNVVSIFQVGELQTTRSPYFIMQFIEGNTLDQEFPQGTPAPEASARRIIAEVAAALAAAHARGLVHRDIKTSNIMLDPHTGRAVVLDFGISATIHRRGADEERLTAIGSYIGTPRYMSPEQAARHDATEKSDIYSLGCVAFELLTGQQVFAGDSILELFAAHLRDVPRAVSSLRPGVDPELDVLVSRCLEKDPAKRPAAIEIAQRLSPDGGALLEWPPPRLERLRGAIPKLAEFFAIGSTLTLASLVILLQLGAQMRSARVSFGALMIIVLAVAGVLLLLEGCRRALVLGRAASKLVRSGYAWLTLLEVVSDFDGETGDLINGSRRFGGVRAEFRSPLRSRRVLRAGALILAALSPVPALLVLLAMGSSGLVGRDAIWAPLVVSMAFVLIANWLRRKERALAPARAREARRVESGADSTIAPLWYESFESARAGQHLGRGPAIHASAGVLGGVLATGLIALVACILFPVLIVGAVGGSVWAEWTPPIEKTRKKIVLAEAWREFTVPSDSGITPLAAGRAFFALQPGGPGAPGFPEVVVTHVPFPWDSVGAPDGLFPTAKPDSGPSVLKFKGPSPRAILPAAMRGFSRDEMAYLERIAHDPVWRTVDTVARARSVDFVGGRFVLPFSESASPFGMPTPFVGRAKSLAYATPLRAAYYMARGQRDSAEVAIRTSISFGFAMSDNGATLTDQLVGIVLVGIGRDALLQYYALTNNPRAKQLKVRLDSITAQFASVDSVPNLGRTRAMYTERDEMLDPQRARVLLRAIVLDRTQSRALRFELLHSLAFAPCTNPREMLFGHAEDIESVFAVAQRELARYPSERALVDLIRNSPEAMTGSVSHSGLGPRVASGAALVASKVLRNPRLVTCTELLLATQLF